MQYLWAKPNRGKFSQNRPALNHAIQSTLGHLYYYVTLPAGCNLLGIQIVVESLQIIPGMRTIIII